MQNRRCSKGQVGRDGKGKESRKEGRQQVRRAGEKAELTNSGSREIHTLYSHRRSKPPLSSPTDSPHRQTNALDPPSPLPKPRLTQRGPSIPYYPATCHSAPRARAGIGMCGHLATRLLVLKLVKGVMAWYLNAFRRRSGVRTGT
jgi:hypothetical protein